ncbi:MAG: phospho-N-acetylmuramoyl-pentapeptide-transferase [Candidatus Cloacimonetes bacterium]|nr:phospho-N-acetylmuramoyl-pentapeptide-transferase [Candidatus Cloacimonadota bacterium]
MFYHLLLPLTDQQFLGFYPFNVFQYITFRVVIAFIFALLYTIIAGPHIINKLKKHHLLQEISTCLPHTHNEKRGTPSMGGIIPLSGVLITSLLWNNLTSSSILIMYLTTIWLGSMGFFDDYHKNVLRSGKKLRSHYKLLGQIILALLIGIVLFSYRAEAISFSRISLPFFKDITLNLGVFFIPFVIFLIVSSSNACNITDGLDGLATGTVIISLIGLGIMSYIKGNMLHAEHLRMDYLADAGELTIYISALIGALLGFLWFNAKPAEVFLGDTGSLALGGQLAVISILLREEIFLMIIGGVFIIEIASSILQISYFKYTKGRLGTGKRLFRCAPLHHHYELKGLSEEKIVARFWIVALLFLAVGLATIKLR